MSNYVKPTISLMGSEPMVASASSCSASTADAEYVKKILLAMGYSDVTTAFSTNEFCENPVDIAGYCKFSSAIQVFFS